MVKTTQILYQLTNFAVAVTLCLGSFSRRLALYPANLAPKNNGPKKNVS